MSSDMGQDAGKDEADPGADLVAWDREIPTLDEPLWRWEGWASHRSARLTDGQVWHFPRIGLAEAMAIPGFADLIARIPPIETDDPADIRFWNQQFQIDAVCRDLAARLLRLNYALSRDQADALTRYPILFQAELSTAVSQCLFGDDPHVPADWDLIAFAENDGCLFVN